MGRTVPGKADRPELGCKRGSAVANPGEFGILRPMKSDAAIAGAKQADLSMLLRRNGINPTPQRLEIAGVLLERPQHLSADQVLERVNRSGSVVAKATVYNTLSLLVARGLARQVVVDPGKVFFDSNTCVHYHFYNEDTGELVDFPAENVTIKSWPCLSPETSSTAVDVVVRVRNRARS